MERSLAHIEKIAWIKPIEGADNIELVGVLGWVCIAKKNEFKVGDKCVYIEIDSLVNEKDERFKFLESKHYKVKTMKLGKFNVISQGLALPVDEFPEISGLDIGADVTDTLKVTYYDEEDVKRKAPTKTNPDAKYNSMVARHKKLFFKWPYNKLIKKSWGRKLLFVFLGKKKDKPKSFPSWIVKTDEVRIENCPFYINSDGLWVKTEKLDGTSCTYAVEKNRKNYDFIVCSRNVRQLDREDVNYNSQLTGVNVYWEMADKYDIESKLTELAKHGGYQRVVLQGECVGEKIQGNPYKLKERNLYVFNVITDGKRWPSVESAQWCKNHSMEHVPIIDTEYSIPKTMEEIKIDADGTSTINPNVSREGFVYRSQDGMHSFKNVSRKYLLKHS